MAVKRIRGASRKKRNHFTFYYNNGQMLLEALTGTGQRAMLENANVDTSLYGR